MQFTCEVHDHSKPDYPYAVYAVTPTSRSIQPRNVRHPRAILSPESLK